MSTNTNGDRSASLSSNLQKPKSLKVYIGDSVYADSDGYSITLTTENGHGPTNTIVLDPVVLQSLDIYRTWLKEQK